MSAWRPSESSGWLQTVHLVVGSLLASYGEMESRRRSRRMAMKTWSGMFPWCDVPRSERVVASWQLSKSLCCWVRLEVCRSWLKVSSCCR